MLAGPGGLCGLYFHGHKGIPARRDSWRRNEGMFVAVRYWLSEYFAGRPIPYRGALELTGTFFQKEVWGALREIPWGQTRTYGEIATGLGRPSASRAVGMAIGRNPISLIVPCHRVVGCDGNLTGYAGGLRRKESLLRMEGSLSNGLLP